MEPRVIARAPEGAGCPRCGGFVYAAEQKLARGRVSIYLILDYQDAIQVLDIR